MQPKVKPFIFSLVLIGCVSAVLGMTVLSNAPVKHVEPVSAPAPVSKTVLYDSLRLDTLALSREAYLYAMEGYKNLQDAGESPKGADPRALCGRVDIGDARWMTPAARPSIMRIGP